MKEVLTILLASLTMFASAQTIHIMHLYEDYVEYYDRDSTKLSAEGRFRNGLEHDKWKYYYESGAPKQVSNYVEGKLHGQTIVYYENGNVQHNGYFYYNMQDSLMQSFWSDGQLMEKGMYDKGAKVGTWEYYHANGKPSMVEKYTITREGEGIRKYNESEMQLMEYWDESGKKTVSGGKGYVERRDGKGVLREKFTYKDGYMHGAFEEYFGDKQVRVTGEYTLGKRSGNWKHYYKNGQVHKDITYANDEMEGKYTRYFETGEVNVTGSHKAGVKDGEWKWFTQDGGKDMIGNFQNDQQHGKWTYWYPNGKEYYMGNYENGKKEGTWKYNYKSGKKWKEGTFKADLKDGEWIHWHESGGILQKGSFVAGAEDGFWESWYESGQQKDQGNFKMGKLDGAWKGWYPSGGQYYEGQWKDDLKTGKWTYWFSNGKLKETGEYKIVDQRRLMIENVETLGASRLTSVKSGTWTEYNKYGTKLSEGNYKNGKPNGKWIYYYDTGVKFKEQTVEEGLITGKVLTYHPNAQLQSEQNYKDGHIHGDSKRYNERGQLTSHKIFKNGHLEKTIK